MNKFNTEEINTVSSVSVHKWWHVVQDKAAALFKPQA
jgi:hypothetical protein